MQTNMELITKMGIVLTTLAVKGTVSAVNTTIQAKSKPANATLNKGKK